MHKDIVAVSTKVIQLRLPLKFMAGDLNRYVHNYYSVSNRHRLVLSSLSRLPLIATAALRLQDYVRAGDDTQLSDCGNIPNVRRLIVCESQTFFL